MDQGTGMILIRYCYASLAQLQREGDRTIDGPEFEKKRGKMQMCKSRIR